MLYDERVPLRNRVHGKLSARYPQRGAALSCCWRSTTSRPALLTATRSRQERRSFRSAPKPREYPLDEANGTSPDASFMLQLEPLPQEAGQQRAAYSGDASTDTGCTSVQNLECNRSYWEGCGVRGLDPSPLPKVNSPVGDQVSSILLHLPDIIYAATLAVRRRLGWIFSRSGTTKRTIRC